MAATSNGPTKVKSSVLQRLPRLSTAVWILIIVCLFLITIVPLAMGYFEQTLVLQPPLEQEIRGLQSEYDALKLKIASGTTTGEGLDVTRARLRDAKSFLPNLADSSRISQAILDLAWDPSVDVTITNLSMTETADAAAAIKNFPSRDYSINMTGQVDNFQKFLRAIGDKLPSSSNANFTITPAIVEGELDQAVIYIKVYWSKFDK